VLWHCGASFGRCAAVWRRRLLVMQISAGEFGVPATLSRSRMHRVQAVQRLAARRGSAEPE